MTPSQAQDTAHCFNLTLFERVRVKGHQTTLPVVEGATGRLVHVTDSGFCEIELDWEEPTTGPQEFDPVGYYPITVHVHHKDVEPVRNPHTATTTKLKRFTRPDQITDISDDDLPF